MEIGGEKINHRHTRLNSTSGWKQNSIKRMEDLEKMKMIAKTQVDTILMVR